MVATEPTVLILANDAHVVAELSLAARAARCVAYPARTHETGVDALERTTPDVVLVHVAHPAVDSHAFRRSAESLGARILLFGFVEAGERPAGPSLIDPKSQLPVIQLNAGREALVRALERVLRGAAEE